MVNVKRIAERRVLVMRQRAAARRVTNDAVRAARLVERKNQQIRVAREEERLIANRKIAAMRNRKPLGERISNTATRIQKKGKRKREALRNKY